MSTDLNPPVAIALTAAIKINGIDVSVLQMRRPTMAQQIAARMAAREAKWVSEQEDLHMFASLCGVTPQDLLQLDMADYLHMVEVFAHFLKRPPMPSASSSVSTHVPFLAGAGPTF